MTLTGACVIYLQSYYPHFSCGVLQFRELLFPSLMSSDALTGLSAHFPESFDAVRIKGDTHNV